MTLPEIEACIRLAERHRVSEFTLSKGGATLLLRAGAGAAGATVAPTPAAGPAATIRAGAAGVFRLANGAEGVPPVVEGMPVRPGTVVGFVQVGPCLRPVVAAVAGVLGAPLVEDGTLVGFGAPLFGLQGL